MIKFEDIFSFINELGIEYKYTGLKDGFIEGFCALSDLKEKHITWIRDNNNFNFENIDANLGLLIVTNFSKISNLTNHNFVECDNPRTLFF